MSATPAAQPEVSPLAELLAPDLYYNVNGFKNYIQLVFVNQLPTWRGLLLVKKVFLVKQLSKRSEYEYFVAQVELPDRTLKYISLERAGRVPDYYGSSRPLNRFGRYPSQSDTSLVHSHQPTGTDRPACADPPLPIDHNFGGLPDLNTLSVPSNESTIRQVGPGKQCSSTLARSSSASLDSLSPPHNAHDIIRGHAKPTQAAGDVVIGTICFDPTIHTPVYLHELVVLANTIHNSNRCYLLFSMNCYWFAGMLMNVLEKRINLEMDTSAKRLFMGKVIKKRTFVKVYKQAPLETVETVLAEFEKNLSDFERETDERHRNFWSRTRTIVD